jgi:hypothetical protein
MVRGQCCGASRRIVDDGQLLRDNTRRIVRRREGPEGQGATTVRECPMLTTGALAECHGVEISRETLQANDQNDQAHCGRESDSEPLQIEAPEHR